MILIWFAIYFPFAFNANAQILYPEDPACPTDQKCIERFKCLEYSRLRRTSSRSCGWNGKQPLVCCSSNQLIHQVRFPTSLSQTLPLKDESNDRLESEKPVDQSTFVVDKHRSKFLHFWNKVKFAGESAWNDGLALISPLSKPEALNGLQRVRHICGTRLETKSTGSSVHNIEEWPWYASVVFIRKRPTEESRRRTRTTGHFLSLAHRLQDYYNKLNASQRFRFKIDDDPPIELLNEQNVHREHHCGATIISDRFLLTAAHCFASKNVSFEQLKRLRIGVAASKVDQMSLHRIAHVHIHPNASTRHYYNDIAIVELEHPLIFDSKVRPACVSFARHLTFGRPGDRNSDPHLNMNTRFNRKRSNWNLVKESNRSIDLSLTLALLNTEGQSSVLLGLGDTQFGGKRATVLQKADLIRFNTEKCNLSYQRLQSEKLHFGLDQQFLCAGDRKISEKFLTKPTESSELANLTEPLFFSYVTSIEDGEGIADACQGDSGGPLLVSIDKHSVQASLENVKRYSPQTAALANSLSLNEMYRQLDEDSSNLSLYGLIGRFYLIGIVSLGKDCADPDYPGVYVNVHEYQSWISSVLSNAN